MKKVIFTFLIITLCISHIFCSNFISSKSCNYNDVFEAINQAKTGDTVIIPSGTSLWTETIILDKNITLKGAGIDKTIIKGGKNLFSITLNDNNTLRITGFTFNGNFSISAISIKNAKNFRIDNNKFIYCYDMAIVVWGYSYGVIDNNIFIDNSIYDIAIYGDNDEGWIREAVYLSKYGKTLGHPEFVFVEDNNFLYTGLGKGGMGTSISRHSIASNYGARYVFRYNYIKTTYIKDKYHMPHPIDVHGNYYYGRGTVAYEIYENTIESKHSNIGIGIRGGTGVIFNNNLIGDYNMTLRLTNYRSFYSNGTTIPDNCNHDFGDDYHPNCCLNDYPCIDQINNLFIWDNKYNGSINKFQVFVHDAAHVPDHIKLNRDFFLRAPDQVGDIHYNYKPYEYPHPLVKNIPHPIKVSVK